MNCVEIEIDGPRNESYKFFPLDRIIRGKFDFMRGGDGAAILEAQKWPGPIPSQRLGIDPDGDGYLTEPLNEPPFAAIRERITKQGFGIEKDQVFENIDLPTWLFWIQQAVEAGLAKITRGKLPEVIEGKPKKDFLFGEPPVSNTDKLTEALTLQSEALSQQTAAFNRLTDAILKSLEK